MVGVGVNVTLAPEQIDPMGFAAIVTEGATTGNIIIVMLLDVAVEGETQVALEVMITRTTSELFSVAEE